MSQVSKRVIAKWCSLASLALVTLVLIILSWFYTTESGLQWLVARTTGFQPQALQIGNVSGTLSTQVRLTELNWQQDKQNIQAKGLTVNCQLLHLLDGLVSCKSVDITSLTLVSTSGKIPDNKEQSWPELSAIKLPIKVKVKQITIANIHYQQISSQGASTIKRVSTEVNNNLVNSISVENAAVDDAVVHNTEVDNTGTNNNASKVSIDNTHASEDSNYEIVTLKVANLALMRSKVSLGKLTAVFQEHNLSASGYVDMRKKWSHQLDVKVSGPSLVSNIKSKGDISQLSKLTLQLQEPQQLTITSDWFYNQRLFLKHGKLTANNQRVEIAQQAVVIEQAKATFDLDWPKLTSSLQAQSTWQTLENIQLEMNTDLADVLDWQSDSKITVQVKSELSEAQVSTSLQYVLPSDEEDKALANTKVDTKVLTKSQTKTANKWPVLLKANIAVKQGLLSVNSDELTLGELSAVLQGEFKINDPLAENFFFKGEIKGNSLALEHSLSLENIDASWQIQKQQSTWLVASQGRINKLGLATLAGENIRWSVDFSERWQADVQAGLLRINDVDIEQSMLKVTGLAQAHQVMLGAKLADENRIDLSFDGTFMSDESDKLAIPLSTPLAITSELTDATWQISNLDFSALHQEERLLLSAEQLRLSREKQSISNLCLKGTGRFCVNAEHNIKQWTTNINFEQWSVSPAIEQLKAWQTVIPVALPKVVEGIVNGKVALSGQNSTVANVTANLTIPYVKWSSSDVEIAGQDIVINTQQQQKKNKKLDSQEKITLVTQWQRINSSLQFQEWPSKISMPEGRFLLSFSPDLYASAKVSANTSTKTKTKASTDKEVKGSFKATPNLNYELDFDLQQSDIVLSIPDEKNDSEQLQFQHLLTFPLLNISGKWQQDKISSRLLLKLPAEDEISAQLSSEWPLTDTAKISGEFSVNLQQFEWLKQWQKRIDKIDVSLVQSFALAGSWQKPQLDGKGVVDIKHLVVDEYGLDIRDSQVKITSQQDLITLTGELQNPQGALTLTGKTKLSAPITADLTLEGQQVTLVNNSENKLIVSPKLKANYQNKHLKVDGHLVIDQADIKIASLPKSAVSVSEDQVIVNVKDRRLKDSAFDYNIALTIAAGDNVKISGFGLSSAIRGDLSASLLTGQPLVLNGRLDLEDGKFEAYKQVLTIEQGQLLFLGAAENPSIQFRAVRVVDEIKVGIIADGTIHKPRLTLFSEPTLADENVLSLLITGRNLDSLSTQEGNALTSAAISLGVESANKVVQKIGDKLGLKDVAFTSKNGTNGGSTRVDLAAKINDRLNVGYGTSIDSDNSIQAGWNIEYKLSDNISFEATSGEEISANINYKKQYSPSKEKVDDENEKKAVKKADETIKQPEKKH